MKKLIFSTFVLLLIIIASNHTNCQNGWIDNGNFKEITTEDSLQSLHFNPAGDVFYTLHNNKIVYYYDVSSGNKFDSLVIPENNAIVNFSKDGNTLVYYLGVPYTTALKFQFTMFIVDLKNKKIIVNSIIEVPNSIQYKRPNYDLGWIYIYKPNILSYFDYNYKKNIVYISTLFEYYYAVNYNPYVFEYYNDCGGFATFEVLNDRLFKTGQSLGIPIADFLKVKDVDYYTVNLWEHNKGGSSSLNSDNYKYSFLLGKYDLQDSLHITLKTGNYSYGNSYETGKGTKYYQDGKYSPYATLFYQPETNSVLMKSLDWYFRFNVNTDALVDSIQLRNSSGLEKLSPDNSSFIYYDTTKILIQNITDRTISDSIDCSIIPVALEVSPNGRDIVIADNKGKIILYDKVLMYAIIPDNNFERALIKLGLDTLPLDNKVLFSNIDTVTYLELRNLGISNLKGIGSFQNLSWLDCSRNIIEELDVSLNTKLKYLNCSNNYISKLNFGDNKNLTFLNCDENRFKQIDVTGLDLLKDFSIYYNDVDSFDFSHNLLLENVNISNNKIKKIQLPQSTNLKNLNCSFNELNELEMQGLQSIESINCSNNNLVYLNMKSGNNDKIINFNALNNPELFCIQVDDSIYSSNNPSWKKDASAKFSENCGYLGVEELYNKTIKIIPNPAEDYIEISEGAQRAVPDDLAIYDIFGTRITTPSNLTPGPSPMGDGKIKIDVSGLSPGVYFVRVGKNVKKFVKF